MAQSWFLPEALRPWDLRVNAYVKFGDLREMVEYQKPDFAVL